MKFNKEICIKCINKKANKAFGGYPPAVEQTRAIYMKRLEDTSDGRCPVMAAFPAIDVCPFILEHIVTQDSNG
jgi:hypothetical protein